MQYSKYQSPGSSPGLLFWQTSSLWKREVNTVLLPYKITHTQYVILAVVSYLQEIGLQATQKTISDFSNIDPMTVSKTIRLMEERELLSRVRSKLDTRAKLVRLKEAGTQTLAMVLPLVEEVDTRFFGRLTQADEQALLSILNKLLSPYPSKD